MSRRHTRGLLLPGVLTVGPLARILSAQLELAATAHIHVARDGPRRLHDHPRAAPPLAAIHQHCRLRLPQHARTGSGSHCQVEGIELALRELRWGGISDMKIVVLSYWDFVDKPTIARLYPDGAQASPFPGEFQSELLTSDGQSRHVFWHAVVWRDGGGRLRGTILIGDDVTALRQEEEQTSLYVKAFEATNHAIVVTDVQGTILSINRAFTQLTGYSNEEALGANPRLLQSGRHDPDFYRSMWATLLATAALALGQIEEVIRAIRGQPDRPAPATLSATLEFDVVAGSITSRHWPRHPRCRC